MLPVSYSSDSTPASTRRSIFRAGLPPIPRTCFPPTWESRGISWRACRGTWSSSPIATETSLRVGIVVRCGTLDFSGWKLVAGAGFEPAVPQSRDYGPTAGSSPVIREKPVPPFCRLSLFSSLRAAESVSFSLCQTSCQGPRALVHLEVPALCWRRRCSGSALKPT